METPNQIQLTEKDKARYRKEIEQVDLEIEEEVMKCISVLKLAREKQDEIIVKELLLKYVDGYTSETV